MLFTKDLPLIEHAKELLNTEEHIYSKNLLKFVIGNKRGIPYKRNFELDLDENSEEN